jgi:vitamin B12 transporter
MGFGFYGEQTPELLQNTVYDEETTGGRGKLIWEGGMQTAVLGVDVDYGRLTEKLSAGPFLQSVYEYPPVSKARAHINRWAIYANDTIIMNQFSITPGVRYDDNNITGSFVSPSLGVTYQFQKDSILRASVARGFAVPGLAWTSGGALFISPNPSLDSERVWSYQGGLETAAFRYFWIKGTFFYHELSDYQTLLSRYPDQPTDLIVNDGKVKQLGGEIEAQTMSFHNFSLYGGFSYVHSNQPALSSYRYRYMLTPGLVYDDQRSFRAEFFGRYLWWGVPPPSDGKYDDFICDLNLNKKIYSKNDLSSELFFTGHNLFNGSQYVGTVYQNPRRWVEAGIRIEF